MTKLQQDMLYQDQRVIQAWANPQRKDWDMHLGTLAVIDQEYGLTRHLLTKLQVKYLIDRALVHQGFKRGAPLWKVRAFRKLRKGRTREQYDSWG